MPATSDEHGSVQACGASRRTRLRGEEGKIVAKAELEEENMELAGCARSSICGGDVSGARRGSAVRSPLYQVWACGLCFIFGREMLIGRSSCTWGWTVNEISSGHGHPPGSSEGATGGKKSSAVLGRR